MSRPLLRRITSFLEESGLPPTLFGRLAVGDPRLVSDLRAGRECGHAMVKRVERFMNKWRTNRQQQEQGQCR
jgi:hypothetical protein